MRKIAVLTMFCVVGLVGSAQAVKPPHPQHPAHPTKSHSQSRARGALRVTTRPGRS